MLADFFLHLQSEGLQISSFQHMWRQSWGTGTFWAGVNIDCLFLSLYEGRKSRMVSYEEDFTETQSTEERSKKSRAVEQPSPAWTAKPSVIPTNFLWGIFALEKQMRDIHPLTSTLGTAAEEFLGLSISLVRRGEKEGSQWESEQEYCCQPPHIPGRRELSNAHPCPSRSKGLQKAPEHHQRDSHCKTGVVFFGFLFFSFFEVTLFLPLLSLNI